MDCAKVGRLIAQLRKEKGLTQQQVAEKLHISNKTVSKWECGLGCPDVTLWHALSNVLGADVLRLLQGELQPNKPDIGKMQGVRFYVCPICGNILTSTGTATISCCGRKLLPLQPQTCTAEHEIIIDEIDLEYCITLTHDMTKVHYIAFAAYVHADSVLLIRLYPEQSPLIRLPITKRGGNIYVYCTVHGLQKHLVRL